MDTKPVFHGSDIEKICEYYHLNKDEIVRFGANVNPLGISEKVKADIAAHVDLLSSYPDREYTSLRETISEYCSIPAEFILPGKRIQRADRAAHRCTRPEAHPHPGPTYSEYSRELALSGSTQEYYHLKEEQDFRLDVSDLCRTLSEGYDFLIICNPNNPTSSAILHDDMEQLLTFCAEHDIFVMIDETYVEFAPDISTVTAVPFTKRFTNLMVLRGVSKFFAAPGMRFGYGITGNINFLKKMKEKQIPWSLNSIGAFAGEKMFKDQDYIHRTRALILSERDRMYRAVSEMPGYKAYEPYANFILLKILKEGVTSADIFDRCIRKGLMIRDCASFQCLEGEYIRFCVMMPEDNTRLLHELSI